MDISITLGKKKFTFNLNEELQINAETIEDELKEQPSYYGYLGMLKNKLGRKVADDDLEINKKYAKLYLKYKAESTQSSQASAEKEAKYKTESNITYIGMCKAHNKLKEHLETIKTCLESFDQRSRMVQSINTNRRKEH